MIVMLVTVGQLLQISELGLLPSLFPNGPLVPDIGPPKIWYATKNDYGE